MTASIAELGVGAFGGFLQRDSSSRSLLRMTFGLRQRGRVRNPPLPGITSGDQCWAWVESGKGEGTRPCRAPPWVPAFAGMTKREAGDRPVAPTEDGKGWLWGLVLVEEGMPSPQPSPSTGEGVRRGGPFDTLRMSGWVRGEGSLLPGRGLCRWGFRGLEASGCGGLPA